MISADQLEKTVFWYLDTNALFANANQNAGFEARRLLTTQNASGNAPQEVNVIIPLNRYSFFEVLEDKTLIPMQLQFNIILQNDDELIQKAASADAGKVVLNRFLLWAPKLIPKDSFYDNFVSSFLKETKWSYLRSMYQMSAPSQASGFYQISASVDNVQHIFVSKEIKQMSWQKILTYLILIN